MGYVSNNLMPQERVLYTGSVHWFTFAPGAVLIGIALWAHSLQQPAAPSEVIQWVVVMFSVFGAFALLRALVAKTSTELAVTDRRVIAKFGLIRRNTIELNHAKVEGLQVKQSILGRVFGYGTLTITGTGGGQTPIPKIAAPLVFRRQAMQAIEATA